MREIERGSRQRGRECENEERINKNNETKSCNMKTACGRGKCV